MKISFFIGGLSGGGAERVTCNLANYMRNAGHEVTIVTMADDAPSYFLEYDIKRVILLKTEERSNIVSNSLRRLFRFYKHLHNNTTDVFVVMLPITTIMLLFMKRYTSAKVIAAERSYPSIYTPRVQNLLRKLAKRADGWVFQTPGQQEWYSKGGIRNNIIIPNAINPAFIKPPFVGERKKQIVTVGSLTKPKNHELLITAFSLISNQFPDYKLIIYGKGNKLELLVNMTRELGIDSQVDFHGYSKQIDEDIIDSSLYVLSSDYEGMPNSLMEAMALGLPCVSTDCDGGGARYLINSEQNGLLVPKGDTEALAEAMKRMLLNKDFAAECGQEAHNISKQLSPDIVYGKWEHFIKETVNS